jgi:glucose-1-phosphatase
VIKTIFLDFGNVIGFFDHNRAVGPLAEHSPFDAVTLEKMIYGGPEEDAYERGKLSTEEFVDFAMKAGQFTVSRATFLHHFADIFTPNPDVCELIPLLAKHYRLVLASNTNEAHYLKYSTMFERELSVFSALCPSHIVGHRKPHPDYYVACQQHAAAQPSECLFVDDIAKNIDAAVSSVGWQGLLYRKGNTLRQRLNQFGIAV